uniref:Chlorophyllase n=1 Tax=Oryza sativa subsp. japonica TaxID=39947 RepID=Q7F0M3_ORYSJ|nr:hypothetical protein [Oryza sativa Japonica Group]
MTKICTNIHLPQYGYTEPRRSRATISRDGRSRNPAVRHRLSPAARESGIVMARGGRNHRVGPAGGTVRDQGGTARLLPSLSHRRRSPSPVIAPKFVSLSIAAAAADLHGCAAASPLLVAAPCDADEYQVVVFLHGYLASNSFESQLFEHVASHGFVVVGPR